MPCWCDLRMEEIIWRQGDEQLNEVLNRYDARNKVPLGYTGTHPTLEEILHRLLIQMRGYRRNQRYTNKLLVVSWTDFDGLPIGIVLSDRHIFSGTDHSGRHVISLGQYVGSCWWLERSLNPPPGSFAMLFHITNQNSEGPELIASRRKASASGRDADQPKTDSHQVSTTHSHTLPDREYH